MTDPRFELTRDQKEILLRGLRFVRSSVALDVCDHTDEIEAARRSQYEEIGRLQELLEEAPVVEGASV